MSDRMAALGIKLGVWSIRGIPRAAADGKLPIAGSPFTADQAAVHDRDCTWSTLNYGTNAPGPAAVALLGTSASCFASVSTRSRPLSSPSLAPSTPGRARAAA